MQKALDCPNAIAQREAAVLLAKIAGPGDEAQLLAFFRALTGDGRRHRENQNTGFVALALASAGAKSALPVLDEWLSREAKWHSDEQYWALTQYAAWMLRGDGDAPEQAVRQDEAQELLPFALCACADLHNPAGIASVERVLTQEITPETREIATETLSRLRAPQGPAAAKDWMVWMLGTRQPTERALGAPSDNLFAQRAQRADLVVEEDASLPDP